MSRSPLVTLPEVTQALAQGKPVVALESTIIAHGLPWPENLDIARALEGEIRAGGAAPATIAVVAGRLRVGLSSAELEALAQESSSFAKAGATDLAAICAQGGNAATTVSATAFLAAKAGIPVFATGGIGGVHRGDSGDVSCDLTILARTPIAVVSAGAKAILDLPRTVEALETLGVLLVGFKTSEFPAFYHAESGIPLEHRASSPEEVAMIMTHRFRLGQGGILVCNPIPSASALTRAEVDDAIQTALALADANHIRGKALTPFLLRELDRITGGAAVRANRALALANARVAAQIAKAYLARDG